MMTNSGRIITVWIITGLIVFFGACGKKGPPVPPGIPPLPSVKGLDYTLTGTRMTLAWKPLSGRGAEQLAGFTVLRSVTRPGDEPCEGCPMVFTRVKQLGATQTEYHETVTPGWTYIYKVIGVTDYKATSPDSRLIRFTVPLESEGEEAP